MFSSFGSHPWRSTGHNMAHTLSLHHLPFSSFLFLRLVSDSELAQRSPGVLTKDMCLCTYMPLRIISENKLHVVLSFTSWKRIQHHPWYSQCIGHHLLPLSIVVLLFDLVFKNKLLWFYVSHKQNTKKQHLPLIVCRENTIIKVHKL